MHTESAHFCAPFWDYPDGSQPHQSKRIRKIIKIQKNSNSENGGILKEFLKKPAESGW